MRDYKTLLVWQKAHALVIEIDALAMRLPRDRGTLKAQMRRSAESIPTNIVEGCARGTQGEFRQFLQISAGSGGELEYQLQLARDYGLMDVREWQRLNDQTVEVRKMLIGLIKKVRADARQQRANERSDPRQAGGM